MNCALYRTEKIGDKEYYSIREYCDGLDELICKNKECRFYKSSEEWRAVTVRKQTQYVRVE